MIKRLLICLTLFLSSFTYVYANEQSPIPITIEYDVISSISISNTHTDEFGILYFDYSIDKEFVGEVTFKSDYEKDELFINMVLYL